MSGRLTWGHHQPSASRAMGSRDSNRLSPQSVFHSRHVSYPPFDVADALINMGVFLVFPVAALVVGVRLLLLFSLGH